MYNSTVNAIAISHHIRYVHNFEIIFLADFFFLLFIISKQNDLDFFFYRLTFVPTQCSNFSMSISLFAPIKIAQIRYQSSLVAIRTF